jgi:class 3 adenylate cyclase/tetratricopeptide (TPR) repeat protein
MTCPQCAFDNPPGMAFCGRCGGKLASLCPSCGFTNPEGFAFCGKCGSRLTPESAPPPPSRPSTSPLSYTPKHLAEKILTSKSALEGERKQVTVLFCDLVDSSRLTEHLDPEAMHAVMDGALRLMAEAVHRYEGTVNQFLGDGLMALFGAPVALEDHALRGVQAALAIRETLSGYSEQLKQDRGVELHLRLGLNTGPVVVGRIGDDLRMDYTAIGDTTHLASRVQALAEPDTILVSEATHRLVEGYIRSEALGPVQVKGRSEPVAIYRVLGRRRGRTRLEVSVERGLTGLVGRERELGLLHDCLARARGGRGQVVGLVGEPGVGKSRLLYEFRRSLEGERVTWLEGHCVAYGQTTPYLPILEMLRTNFQIEEEDNPLQIQEKLRQGVHRLDPALEAILPFLHDLFSLPGGAEALKHLEPKDKRQKTFEAIRTLTLAGSQRRLHVLILEDLHWIDQTSEDYLAFVTAGLAGVPVLLLTTQRPGYPLRWGDKTYYTQIALDVLTEGETEALVAALLGVRTLPSDLVRLVREKAEGNPLFVEEITASLLERGMLVRRDGEIVWTGGAPVEVPATIQDIIRARIDRLEDPVKRTVQAAAVIGREFGLRLLRRISEMAAEVEQYLDTLKHAELIHETRFFPELAFIFKHAVTQDVAYQSLLAQRRKELHGAIGRAIEDLYADRLGEHAPILAYHYARSERPGKAIEYALLAGDQAARLYANAEAATYYDQALTMARALPPTPRAHGTEIDAALKLAAVGMTRQHIERDRQNVERARELAQQLQDERRLARALHWLGRLQYVLGNSATAIAYAEQSLEIADRLGEESLAAPPVNLMARAHHWSDFAKGCHMIERSVEQMARLGNKGEEATASGFAAVLFAPTGEFDRALVYANRGVELAQEIQNPLAEAAAYGYRGILHDQRGEWARAIADYECARRVAEGAGDPFRMYIVKFWEGRAYARAGDASRGRTLVEEGFALAERIGTKFALAHGKVSLAECLLALGELDEACRVCEDTITLSEDGRDRFHAALAHRILAESLSRLRPSDAQSPLGEMLEAIGIQQELGVKPELARSYVSYARLLEARGNSVGARDYLVKAIGMFRDMGMAWDLERAEQTLRVL